MKPTGQTSDSFKFHLRKLMQLGYVNKTDRGTYQLTTEGKEFSNSLDEKQRTLKKQPKLSVLLIIPRENGSDDTEFLLQRRQRHPHFGFWNEITDAVGWGETFEEAAARVLLRQTGLRAEFDIHGMRRIRDYHQTKGALLEDKLFIIVAATRVQGKLQNTYDGGHNQWLTLKELVSSEKYFASTPEIIKSFSKKQSYASQDIIYRTGEY